MHPRGDVTNGGPGVEPCAQGPERAVVRPHRAAGEADRRTKGLAALVDHWIISSARTSNDCGIVRPRAFAVFMLMTSSYFDGCSTGISPGLAPLRILSTYLPTFRQM